MAVDHQVGNSTQVKIEAGRAIDTSLILAISAWVIFNSHLEVLYPLRWLAADGLLGNSMFFMVSGYGIHTSLSARPQSATEFAYRRFLRLYPAVVIAVLIRSVILWVPPFDGWMASLGRYLWPTPFTYVQIVVPLYFVSFLFWKVASVHFSRLLGVVCSLTYLIGFSWDLARHRPGAALVLGGVSWVVSAGFFGLAFASGAAISNLRAGARFTRVRVAVICVLVVVYVGFKYTMVVLGRGAVAYPLLHALTLAVCGLTLLTFGDPIVPRRIAGIPGLGAFLVASGKLSLEIYVIHAVLLHWVGWARLPFPVSILALAAVTFVSARGLGFVTGWIRSAAESPRQVKS